MRDFLNIWESILLQSVLVHFKKDTCLLVREKENYNLFYIIQSGQVCVKRQLEVDSHKNIFGKGGCVGLVSCLSAHNQIETVIALTDVVAIEVNREQYPLLIARNPSFALKIIHAFAREMRVFTEMLTQLTLKKVLTPLPEQMFEIAAYYEKIGKPNLAIYGYYHYIKECPRGEFLEPAKSRFTQLKANSPVVHFEYPVETVRTYPQGTMIFSECQSGQDMFIIQSGKVTISKVVHNNEIILAILQKGDFFGEMALLENKPRFASAIAYSDCTLLAVNRRNFEKMVATQSKLVLLLTTTLAERLWSMSRQIANAQLRDPLSKLFDMLALQLEKNHIPTGRGTSYQFDLTFYDLANMCGILQEEHLILFGQFIQDSRITLQANKIFISDCHDLMKSVDSYRRQTHYTVL